jgi:hypothetical protein
MKTEERIEKLERELAELKKELKPEFEVGWYKNTARDNKDILIYWNEHKKSLYGFDINGDWFDDEEYGFHEYYDIPATDKEVKEALIEEAKRRGFKEGDIVKTNNQEYSITRKLDSANYYGNDAEFHPNSLQCGAIIFQNGQWADIIENKVIINGKEVIIDKDANSIIIGCKGELCLDEFKSFVSVLEYYGCEYVYHPELGNVQVKDLKETVHQM